LAALPHLQKAVNDGHSGQVSFLDLILHFQVVFCGRGVQFWVSIPQNAIIASSKLPYNNIFTKRPACGF
jgi:hypothetical protein